MFLSHEPFMIAFFYAIVLHVLAISTVGFVLPEATPPQKTKTLGVVLLQTRTDSVVKDADYIAQASHEGSGTAEKPQRQTTPTESIFPDARVQEVMQAPIMNAAQVTQSRDEVNRLTTELNTAQQVETVLPDQPQDIFTEANAGKDALTLASLNDKWMNLMQAFSSKQAEIEHDLRQITTVKTEIVAADESVRARQDEAAPYINGWIGKIEKIVNANFKKLADAGIVQALEMTVMVNIVLNADGTPQKLAVSKSSGHPVLDKVALKSIRDGIPYPPFPENLHQRYESLTFSAEFAFKHYLNPVQ